MKFFICCFLLIQIALCDLPVHCKKEQIEGIWTFRISKERFEPSLNNHKTTCGHSFPDKISTEVGDKDIEIESYDEMEVRLASDYKIYDMNNNLIGNWTTVYDEGFIAYIRDSVYTAFMKYYRKNTFSTDDTNYISNCDKTMLGWFIQDKHYNNKNWSCFYGVKSKVLQSPNKNIFLSTFIEMNIKLKEYATLSMKSMMYDAQHDIVNEINSSDLGWKADIHEEFKGLSFFQLQEKLGLKRSKQFVENFDEFKGNNQPNFTQNNENLKNDIASFLKNIDGDNSITKILDQDSKFVKDYSEISKYIDKELDEIDVETLPKNWDWRNVGGVSYVPKLRKQLNCGSCYVFSLVGSLEARLRIMTNNEDKTEFSRQFPLSCSFYTEGCKGGYPIFVAKFFNEYEIIPEGCFQYNPDKVECNNMCDYKNFVTMYYVNKFWYLVCFYVDSSYVFLF
jgi:cathepsin C